MLSLPQLTWLCFAILMAGGVGNENAAKPAPIIRPFLSGKTSVNGKNHVSFSIDPDVSSDTPSCIIPFSRAGNLIIIKAKADTIEGNFILDTGAPKLILNMTYFRDYFSTAAVENDPGGITGSAAAYRPIELASLSLGPIRYVKVEADRINLGHIENSKGIKILGLLGMSLFKKFEMILDYEKNLIYLHLISKKERNSYKSEALSDTATYHSLPISIKENKILASAEIAGKKLSFIVDTGAESNVLDSRLPGKVFENVAITSRIILSGSGAKKTEALYGELAFLTLGSLQLTKLPVMVTNLENMCLSDGLCPDGMLGYDFLSLHKIGFNFVTGKMYIWK